MSGEAPELTTEKEEILVMVRHADDLTGDYSLTPREFCKDSRVTPEAARLYIFMASLDDGVALAEEDMAELLGMPLEGVHSGIESLEKAGWMSVSPLFDKDGVFIDHVFRLNRSPRSNK